MEVIDLTIDSPQRERHADANHDEARTNRKMRRREERRLKDEESDKSDRKRKRDDSRERRRDSTRAGRDRDAEDDRRRRESGEHDPDRKSSRRKKDRERQRQREPDPPIPDEQLFFIDETPAPLPSAALHTAAVPAIEKPTDLILPAHVSVFGETPMDLPVAALDSDEEDYIEYLDYDNRKVCSMFTYAAG
jgi:protein AIR1/2